MADQTLMEYAQGLVDPDRYGAFLYYASSVPPSWSYDQIIGGWNQGLPGGTPGATWRDGKWYVGDTLYTPPPPDPGWTDPWINPPNPTPTPTPTPNPYPTPTPTPNPYPTPNPTPTPNPGTTPLPGYGVSQNLQGFGIPGFETKPMVGGGSWAGTTWSPPPAPNYVHGSDVGVTPGTPSTIPLPTGTTQGLTIQPAIPYNTTDYRQAYPDKLAPYPNIHAQIGAAMQGIEPAKPGFNWGSPQALAALGGYGLPGGWTSMLGFTPGGNK